MTGQTIKTQISDANLEPFEVQCPNCKDIRLIDDSQINYRSGASNGEWWWEATYQCGECGHRWKEGDCSL